MQDTLLAIFSLMASKIGTGKCLFSVPIFACMIAGADL
ncbi:hypothetical protein EOK76_g0078 [Lacticaseibacillus paracasei]|nr:hypothetical protein EOK76_g0078 [Lacticaseibacillus paracasei]